MKPLVNETDYLQTDFLINEFKNGVGKELQKKLLQKGQEERNWVKEIHHFCIRTQASMDDLIWEL